MKKARKVRKSIYGEKIRKVNVTYLLFLTRQEACSPVWMLQPRDSFKEQVAGFLQELDFCTVDYLFYSTTYWCGILTAEPFHLLAGDEGEEKILNMIKDHHLRLVEKGNQLFLEFHNPVKSPYYRFFNRYKEDGYGLNIPYSINGLLNKIEEYLLQEFRDNLEDYVYSLDNVDEVKAI